MDDTQQATVRAAGTVLWRRGQRGVEVALVHRPEYDDWSLPKGKLEYGETTAHAAVRETAEETGFTARLSRRLGTTGYRMPSSGRHKTVTYFAAESTGGAFVPNDEVNKLRWLGVDAARRLAGYGTDRDVLSRFAAVTGAVRTILLVRHAKAGSRAGWTEDDELRPLSEAGAEQARALRSLLPLFGATRVYSAPPVRCVQTVQQVSIDLRAPVRVEPLLGEDGYWDAPEAGLRRLLGIAGGDGVAVVSSQGGVIPDLVQTLTMRWAEPPEVRSKKASVWALFFNATGRSGGSSAAGAFGGGENGTLPRLVAADYYPSPLPVPSTG